MVLDLVEAARRAQRTLYEGGRMSMRLSQASKGLVRTSRADRRHRALTRQKTAALEQWTEKATGTSLNLKRSAAGRKQVKARRQPLVSALKLAQGAAALLADAEAAEVTSVSTLGMKLGEVLSTRAIKVDDLMEEWDRNHDNAVSRGEFRIHVRRLLAEVDGKAIDALFTSLDADSSGELERNEVKSALKRMAKEHEQRVGTEQRARQHAQRLREAALVWSSAAEESAALEDAERTLEALRKGGSAASRLGTLLCARNTNLNDMLVQWDVNGDGFVDRSEFVQRLADLGLEEQVAAEQEELFDSFDNDGSSTLDLMELKAALKELQHAAASHVAAQAAEEAVVSELYAVAKTAQAKATKATAEAMAAFEAAEADTAALRTPMPDSRPKAKTKMKVQRPNARKPLDGETKQRRMTPVMV